ncbi:MAG: TerC family protein [Syntrophomonadaceae bacterium]
MGIGELLIALFSIVIIDIVLGGDNAILIAMASKDLAPDLRKKAMLWGVMGAVGVRGLLASLAVYVLKIPLLQLVGGLVLVWIAIKLLIDKQEVEVESGSNLLEAIKIIIIADVIMGIDNVLAIAGAAHGSVWLVILGLVISVPIIVWGSTFLLRWMEKFPFIIYLGGGVLAWTAGKMIAADKAISAQLSSLVPYYNVLIPTLILIAVLSYGYWRNQRLAQNPG